MIYSLAGVAADVDTFRTLTQPHNVRKGQLMASGYERLLASLLACPNPVCTNRGILTRQTQGTLTALECGACGSLYPIGDGIPLLFHPSEEYVYRMFQSCVASAASLQAFQSRVGEADPYHQFAAVWLARVNDWLEDMAKIRAFFGVSQTPASISPTEEFKTEYAKLEVIEEYLKSAYGIYLNTTAGNREGFYATILSAGKSLPKDALVLDIGCGIGRTLLDYSLLCPQGLIIGFEYVYSTLKLAKQILTTQAAIPILTKTEMQSHAIQRLQGFGRKNIALIAGAAEHLPFQEGTFDCVLGNYIFSIIDDYQSAVHKAARLLKSGGILITTNGFSWEDLREPNRRHDPDILSSVLRESGLDIELDFDFANMNTANPRQMFIRNTRLILGRKRS